MIALGIDPGTRSTGLAIMKDGKIVELACVALKCPKGSRPRHRFFEMMDAVGAVLIEWEEYEVDRIALEWQHIRDGRTEKNPTAITDLSHFGGGMLLLAKCNWGGLDPAILMPTPHDWKGDVEKPIHHARLRIKHPEVDTFGLNKTKMKDALDGAGLAKWVSEKLRV